MFGGLGIVNILSSDFFCFYCSVYIFVQNKKRIYGKKRRVQDKESGISEGNVC